jgi:hypothetical protein
MYNSFLDFFRTAAGERCDRMRLIGLYAVAHICVLCKCHIHTSHATILTTWIVAKLSFISHVIKDVFYVFVSSLSIYSKFGKNIKLMEL